MDIVFAVVGKGDNCSDFGKERVIYIYMYT